MKTKLRIHTWPEIILRQKCAKVSNFDARIKELFEEMISLMRVSTGAGLAGNQAGLDLQLIVIEFDDKLLKLVNPAITKSQGSIVFREGCLSFPDLEIDIKRKNRVWVSAFDEDGRKLDIEAEGILAVIIQHEIDHINGVTFIERISPFQKIRAYPKLKKIAGNTKNELRKQPQKS